MQINDDVWEGLYERGTQLAKVGETEYVEVSAVLRFDDTGLLFYCHMTDWPTSGVGQLVEKDRQIAALQQLVACLQEEVSRLQMELAPPTITELIQAPLPAAPLPEIEADRELEEIVARVRASRDLISAEIEAGAAPTTPDPEPEPPGRQRTYTVEEPPAPAVEAPVAEAGAPEPDRHVCTDCGARKPIDDYYTRTRSDGTIVPSPTYCKQCGRDRRNRAAQQPAATPPHSSEPELEAGASADPDPAPTKETTPPPWAGRPAALPDDPHWSCTQCGSSSHSRSLVDTERCMRCVASGAQRAA